MKFRIGKSLVIVSIMVTGAAWTGEADEIAAGSVNELALLGSVYKVHSLTDDQANVAIRLFETGGGDPVANGDRLYLAIVPDDPTQETLMWKTGIDVYQVREVNLNSAASEIEIEAIEHFVDSSANFQERPVRFGLAYDVDVQTGGVGKILRITRTRESGSGPVAHQAPPAELFANKCYRTKPFSEEGGGKGTCLTGYAARGITCAGDYCDSMVLTCCSFDPPDDATLLKFEGDRFSEEHGPRTGRQAVSVVEDENVLFAAEVDGLIASVRDKPKLLTGLSCSGRYCDNLTPLYTVSPDIPVIKRSCSWDDEGSEEKGFIACPVGKYIGGLKCSGRFCDAIAVACCAIETTKRKKMNYSDAAVHVRALKFAPVLYFDKAAVGEKNCIVADPVVFYERYLAPGVRAKVPASVRDFSCNNDPASLTDVPIFYDYQRHGDSEYFMYWFFYEKQNPASGGLGPHIADWERVMVKVTNGMLAKVMYFAHSGWTTKMAGYMPMENPRQPRIFVGKVHHGSYMNTGGAGMALYWMDYRNPGPDPLKLNTALTLRRLPKDADWVTYAGGWNFAKKDSVRGPRRNENFADFQVCAGNFLTKVLTFEKPQNVVSGGGCTHGHNMGSGKF